MQMTLGNGLYMLFEGAGAAEVGIEAQIRTLVLGALPRAEQVRQVVGSYHGLRTLGFLLDGALLMAQLPDVHAMRGWFILQCGSGRDRWTECWAERFENQDELRKHCGAAVREAFPPLPAEAACHVPAHRA